MYFLSTIKYFIYLKILVTTLLLDKSFGSKENRLPYFGTTESNISVALGRDAVLNCTVFNVGEYKVAWLSVASGSLLTLEEHVISHNPKVSIRHSGAPECGGCRGSWILTLKNIEKSDAGGYMCQVNTEPGAHRMYYVTIEVPPKFIDEETTQETIVTEGDSATLKCSATGTPPPTIKWRREESIRNVHHRNKVDKSHIGEELVINQSTRGDAGAYLCIANNGVPPSISQRVLLRVKFAPNMQVPAYQRGLLAPQGGSATLTCIVRAWPRPTITWKIESPHSPYKAYERDFYISNGRVKKYMTHISDTLSNASLVIRDLQYDDFHTYKCIAKNSEGKDESSIKITELLTTTTTTTTTTSTTTTTTTTTTTAPTTFPSAYDYHHYKNRPIDNSVYDEKSNDVGNTHTASGNINPDYISRQKSEKTKPTLDGWGNQDTFSDHRTNEISSSSVYVHTHWCLNVLILYVTIKSATHCT